MPQNSRMPRKRAVSRKDRVLNFLLTAAVVLFALGYIAKYGGRELLKFYIKSGIGDCVKIPILCMKPSETLDARGIDPEHGRALVPAEFANISISIPEGFTGIEEKIRKVYYRSARRQKSQATIYLLYRPPGFFVELFPRLKKQGVTDDYQFIRRAMNAHLEDITSLTDAFFVIMKGVFIPDLGSQHEVTMAEFEAGDRRGFINYNLSLEGHYFDCNIIDAQGHFFKIYIKDADRVLSLVEVLSVVSTVRPNRRDYP